MNTRTRKLTKKIRKKTGRYKMKGGFENPLYEIDPEEAKAKLESDKEELAKYMMSMNPASQGSLSYVVSDSPDVKNMNSEFDVQDAAKHERVHVGTSGNVWKEQIGSPKNLQYQKIAENYLNPKGEKRLSLEEAKKKYNADVNKSKIKATYGDSLKKLGKKLSFKRDKKDTKIYRKNPLLDSDEDDADGGGRRKKRKTRKRRSKTNRRKKQRGGKTKKRSKTKKKQK